MAKTKEQKNKLVADYKQYLKDSTGVIVISPDKLTANEISDFKQQVAELGSRYHVIKNTLFAIALDEADMPKLETLESGTHAALFVSEDIAGAAKLLKEFKKQNKEKIEFRAGILDGQELTIEQIEELAEMPTKEQSVAIIAGLMTQPIADIANVLEDSVRSVAIIINQAFTE